MDPLELRLKNDTSIDPEKNRPLSGRRLADCLREGADRFGWSDRPTTPAQPARRRLAHRLRRRVIDARALPDEDRGAGADRPRGVRARPVGHDRPRDGHLHDRRAGRGAAAQRRCRPGAGGAGADRFSEGLGRGRLVGIGQYLGRDRHGLPGAARARAGRGGDVVQRPLRRGAAALSARARGDGKLDQGRRHAELQQNSIYTYGATYAEVGVDAYTGEVRLRRMVGVFSCGQDPQRQDGAVAAASAG